MRALIQRVGKAEVVLEDGTLSGRIGRGILVFLGIENEDREEDIQYLVHKISQLRIFDDEAGIMNKSVLETGGSILLVSQFTLHANTKKGNRPSYIRAARPETATPLYGRFIEALKATGIQTETGKFGAMMQVHLVNDGPVTIWLDSKNKDY
ncbi:MAG TPA: D-aminoacyl-tRNA deacylase [Saprospiraceae bacterium]|nr:D-aminoacyl-tRNA deacylase [Saprospiraceae bacterium]HNT20988.1 D-aminoacyl-tRNA deacylase [Saprospiraceae bacterium]